MTRTTLDRPTVAAGLHPRTTHDPAAPRLPLDPARLHLSRHGVTALDARPPVAALKDPLPGFLSVRVTSLDGQILHSHSQVSEHGDIGVGHATPGGSSHGEVPLGGQVRVTLEHPDGFFTAVVRGPPAPKGDGQAVSLAGVRFEWIPRPSAPLPAKAPALWVKPENFHVGRGGVALLDVRPPVAELPQPLPGFTAVELRSPDGRRTHSWSEVNARGSVDAPRASREDRRPPNVPANERLQLVLHHPQGALIAEVPAAVGNDVLRNPHATRRLSDLRFEWHPATPPTPTLPRTVDGWQTSTRQGSSRGAARPVAMGEVAPPSAAPPRTLSDGGAISDGSGHDKSK